jgi:D-alanine--poly(phosphoribitol) ligase subunit 1
MADSFSSRFEHPGLGAVKLKDMYEYNLGLRFQSVAQQRADQTAIWFGGHEQISYVELNRLSNRAARWLLDLGVGFGDVVCLSGAKSASTFACMLACLKIGAVYSMLDPDSPRERQRKILVTCRPKVVLAEPKVLNGVDEDIADLATVIFEKDSEQLASNLAEFEDTNLSQTRSVTGASPAYIMFTSGSTGFPKGAVMTHANVLNLIQWSQETFGISQDDILTNVNPLYFDNSVFDFYSSLFTGAQVVTFTKEEVRDPKLLVEKVDTTGCTVWFSVPSLLIFLQTMKATDGCHLKSIRRFIFGGEGYPKAKLKGLYDAYSDSSELFNVYGPTECTCICSSYRVTGQDFEDPQGLPPLGHIADNFSYLILDEEGRRIPAGDTGELCLLGPNVGKGYYNDTERTAASFVQNPYNGEFCEIMYKTGDMVRFEPADGKLYIQGRRDNQIKHMGYRIELEEIESALHRLDYVSEAAALHASVNGLSRIVAVVALRKEFADDQIRLDLRRIIPDYMIPSVFHREKMLPKNPNGKVDRRRLVEEYVRQKS